MERWRGQTAVVTGASAGIGRASAAALGAAGMRVVALARRGERLRALGADLEGVGCGPGSYLAVEADVKDREALEGVPGRIRDRWGEGEGIDVLVNNAGLGTRGAGLMDGDPARWREMLEVNVVALCEMTRVATVDMERRGRWGQVTHLSSMAGHRVPPGEMGFYAGTKHMVSALAQGLRHEARGRGVPPPAAAGQHTYNKACM